MAASNVRDFYSGGQSQDQTRQSIVKMETDDSTFGSSRRNRPGTTEHVSSNLQTDRTDINLDKTRQLLALLDRFTVLKPEIEKELYKVEKDACRSLPTQTDCELQTKLQRTVAENRKLNEQIEILNLTLNNLKTNIERIGISNTDKEEQDRRLKYLEEENRRLEDNIQAANTKMVEFRKLVKEKFDELQNNYNAAKLEVQEAKKVKEENQRLFQIRADEAAEMSQTIAQREEEIRKSRKQLMDTKKELDETKSRLSQMMGNQMKDGNPYIADLSDKNRPTKLADMYTELYDNEWTDAFDVIQNLGWKLEEKDVSKQLYDILMDINKFCQTEVENQREQLKQCLLVGYKADKTIPDSSVKQLKELQHSNAEGGVDGVYEKYAKNNRWRTSTMAFNVNRVPEFVKKCVYLCWLMTVQDPPLVFKIESESNTYFNKDIYKAYTKYGTYIDFIVWPPLLLHESGPLLAKGIAQGFIHPQTAYNKDNETRDTVSSPSTDLYPSIVTSTTYVQSTMKPVYASGGAAQNTLVGDQTTHQTGTAEQTLQDILQAVSTSKNKNVAISNSQRMSSSHRATRDDVTRPNNQFSTTYYYGK